MTRCILLILLLFSGLVVRADAIRTVRDFGAVGDGQQDDTTAVEKAIAASGSVSFPAGRYRLTRTIRIELDKVGPVAIAGHGATLEMAGAGPALHLVGTVQRTAAPADFPREFWIKQGGVSVSGLDFVGAHPEAVGLQVTRTMQLTVSRCNFRQLVHGIHFTERNRNAIIDACHVYDNRGAGVFVDRVDFHQLNIGNSHISYNRGGGVVVRSGSVRNIQISGCDIEGNMSTDGAPAANVLLDSTGGSIGEVEITGCTIQHFTRGFAGSANVRFIGHSTKVPFTPEHRHGQLVITGNMINDADINIHLDGVRSAIISGNTLHFGPKHDILIENSAHVVLSGNTFDRHPRYQYKPEHAQGIVYRNSTDCMITGLHINGGEAAAALAVHGSRRFHINNCTITGVGGVGLLLEDVSDSFIHGNRIDQGASPKPGIKVTGGKGNRLQNNWVTGRSEIADGAVDAN